MGLFSKKQEPQPQAPAPATAPVVERPVETIYLNIPEKGVRVELVEETAHVKYANIELKDDKIQIISSGRILLAEISKKTKAYAEIEPKIGHRCYDVAIEAKTGDYGLYYRLKLRFSDTVIVTT